MNGMTFSEIRKYIRDTAGISLKDGSSPGFTHDIPPLTPCFAFCYRTGNHYAHTKKPLPCRNRSGYISLHLIKRVPDCNPADKRQRTTAPAVFITYRIIRLFAPERQRAYGNRLRSGPVSVVAGGLQPVRLATQNCNLWMVSFQNLRLTEATPWQTTQQQRAYAARVVTSD